MLRGLTLGGMPSHEQSPACFLRSGVLSLRCLCAGRDGNQSPDSYASATRPPHTSCFAAAATCAAPSPPRLIRVLPDWAQAPPRVGSRWPWAAMRVTDALLRTWLRGRRPLLVAVPSLVRRAFHGRSSRSRPFMAALLAPGLSWPLPLVDLAFPWPFAIPSLQRRPFDSSVPSRAVSADHACGGAVCARASVRGSEHGAA